MPWDRKSYLGPTEILSFVYLVQFKDGGRRVSLRLHLFVFDVDPGNEDFRCKRVGAKIFLRGPRDGKVLLRSSTSCEKGYALEVECGGVWNLWSQTKIFLTLGQAIRIFLELGQAIRNLACVSH